MKKLLSLILCAALLLTLVPLTRAEELQFVKVQINAGYGPVTEYVILSDGELYLQARNFERYTRYQFNPETNTFLVAGQEQARAFKAVVINPETGYLAVKDRLIKLRDSFTVDGVLYLPFCQMMPILNGQIVSAGQGMIYVANPKITLAELLYGFDLQDYYFNLYDEFYGKSGLLLAYVLPSYLFDSVANVRYERLDPFFNSGAFEDYRNILTDYLKDEKLFLRANETYNAPRTILNLVHGAGEWGDGLNDVLDWVDLISKEVLPDEPELLDELWEELLQTGSDLPKRLDELTEVVKYNHNDDYGVSIFDMFRAAEFVYTYANHVEDNHKMLDAVYDLRDNRKNRDVQYRAAQAVYDLYGEEFVPALLERGGKELIGKVLKELASGTKLKLYELTAKLSGAAWELVIPGDTGDVSVLTLHAGVANSAQTSAAGYSLNSEAEVEDYRLSLLLMMMASRKCYEIMADTAESYGHAPGEYRAKIEKLENMIMGLYLVGSNTRYEAYDNFDTLAEENRNLLKSSGLIKNAEIIRDPEAEIPGDSFWPAEDVYLSFLAQNSHYRYYALVDINGDGCRELLATEDDGQPHSYVDLWIYRNHRFEMVYEDIWIKYTALIHDRANHWIESTLGGTGGGGTEYIWLDGGLNLRTVSIEHYDWAGELFNGEAVTDNNRAARDAFLGSMKPSEDVEIQFLPIPAPAMDGEEVDAFMDYLADRTWYRYYALLDIDQDGCRELLAAENLFPDGHNVYLYLYRDGQVVKGWNNIWGSDPNLYYNPAKCRLESVTRDGSDFGVWFYSINSAGDVVEAYFSDFGNSGKWCNGSPVKDAETQKLYDQLKAQYDPSTSVIVEFLPMEYEDAPVEIPEETGDAPADDTDEMTAGALHYYFLAEHPEYQYYALLDINQDGTDEILVCESNVIGEQLVDIWVNQGGIYSLECEDIRPRVSPLTYNSFYGWVENRLDTPSGRAASYYWVEENGEISRESCEPYDTFGDVIVFQPRP